MSSGGNLLTLTDIDYKTLSSLVEYIYGEKAVNILDENAFKLFEAAVDYGIESLATTLERHLIQILSGNNALDLFIVASKKGRACLKKASGLAVVSNWRTLKEECLERLEKSEVGSLFEESEFLRVQTFKFFIQRGSLQVE